MRVDTQEICVVEDYEYGVQRLQLNGEWRMTITNHFVGWYPSKGSAKNALAQLKATRWGRVNPSQYRLVRRPYGKTEVCDG